MYYDPNPKYYKVKKELLIDLIENDCICLDDVCFNGKHYFSNDSKKEISEWEGQYYSNGFAVAFVIDGHYYVTPKVEEAEKILRSAMVRKTIIPVPFSNIYEFPYLLGGEDLYNLCNYKIFCEAASRVIDNYDELVANNYWSQDEDLVRICKQRTQCEMKGIDWSHEYFDTYFAYSDLMYYDYDRDGNKRYYPIKSSPSEYRIMIYYQNLINGNKVFQKWDKLLQESGQLPKGKTLADIVKENLIEHYADVSNKITGTK